MSRHNYVSGNYNIILPDFCSASNELVDDGQSEGGTSDLEALHIQIDGSNVELLLMGDAESYLNVLLNQNWSDYIDSNSSKENSTSQSGTIAVGDCNGFYLIQGTLMLGGELSGDVFFPFCA